MKSGIYIIEPHDGLEPYIAVAESDGKHWILSPRDYAGIIHEDDCNLTFIGSDELLTP